MVSPCAMNFLCIFYFSKAVNIQVFEMFNVSFQSCLLAKVGHVTDVLILKVRHPPPAPSPKHPPSRDVTKSGASPPHPSHLGGDQIGQLLASLSSKAVKLHTDSDLI